LYAIGSFFDNVPSKYHDSGDAISNSTVETDYNLGGTPKMGYITTDIYTSFVLLIGIFFPSCTGKAIHTYLWIMQCEPSDFQVHTKKFFVSILLLNTASKSQINFCREVASSVHATKNARTVDSAAVNCHSL
jgi:hypothetical protein